GQDVERTVVLAHDRQHGRGNGDLEGGADIGSTPDRLSTLADASAHPEEVVRFDADPGCHQEERVPAAEQIILREAIREVKDPSSDDDDRENACENSRSSLFVEQYPTFELSLDVGPRWWEFYPPVASESRYGGRESAPHSARRRDNLTGVFEMIQRLR